MTDTESRYPPLEGEALAIVWALDKFRLWTEGHKIVLVTDHRPLQYIWQNPNNQAKLIRWALRLQTYDMDLSYITGKENVLADASSRFPGPDQSPPRDEDAFDIPHPLP